MARHEITDRINDLIDEEHRLRKEALAGGGLTAEQRERLKQLEHQLDGYVALLRQRQALAAFDDDPPAR
ncbi:DUF2630 family protein [Amycolatopsis sp. H20-H5]|uniref:DUF2630 family protein n=1 Tax=Amycolatopsis sp. H20-H5 TaxID=3046309 RepID=UPI002DC05B92|nr:DUF2630 family protein [Amycolatopsis sp. H20-H5]MEC3977342.1 DUF2630 family protein [Amycolatopsis sp. H20-H5]